MSELQNESAGESQKESQPTKKVTKRMRNAARTYAVQLMYSLELNHYDMTQNLSIYEGQPAAEICTLAEEMVHAFVAERIAIDSSVDKYLQNWTLQRLAYLDRAILRTGCYEIIYNLDAPPSILINDYIELAKEFGSDIKTSKLVNAVLDKVAREHRANEIKNKK